MQDGTLSRLGPKQSPNTRIHDISINQDISATQKLDADDASSAIEEQLEDIKSPAEVQRPINAHYKAIRVNKALELKIFKKIAQICQTHTPRKCTFFKKWPFLTFLTKMVKISKFLVKNRPKWSK